MFLKSNNLNEAKAIPLVGETPRGSAASRTDRVEEVRQLIVAAYEERFPQVFRYIAVRVGYTDIAEDLTSETFVRALRGADKFADQGKPLGAWLFRIAHNLAVDHLRSAKRRPMSAMLHDDITDGIDAPAVAYERKHDIRLLHASLGVLTESERQVVALRFGAELKPEQIGQILGKKAGAVRWLQHSAITKLRAKLGPQFGDGDFVEGSR